MPTALTARKSPANSLATNMSTFATNPDPSNLNVNSTSTISGSIASSSVSSTFVHSSISANSSAPVSSSEGTCTFSVPPSNDYHQYLHQHQHHHHHQQQQQQQQQDQQQQPHYYHNLHPPLPSLSSSSLSLSTNATSANNSTSFATFNGNSNVSMANGNVAFSSNDSNCNTNGNGNSNDTTNVANSQNFSLTPTDVVAGSVCSAGTSGGGGGGGGGAAAATTISTTANVELATTSSSLSSSSTVTVGSGPIVSIIKKTSSSHALQLHASREDITSLGGASSLNSQLSLVNNNSNSNTNISNSKTNNINNNINNKNTNTNISNSNGNSSNSGNDGVNNGNSAQHPNSNNISKESKDGNNYFNGTGSVSAGSVEGGSITDGGAGGSLSSRNTENDDPGDGLGPLPPKWETAYTERGELYFIDHNTGTSHWLDPRLSKFQKKSLEDCGDDELPYGWEKIEDSLYGTYYIDHVNRRTQYENPVLEAKRRAAEQKQKQQTQGQRSQTPTSNSAVIGPHSKSPDIGPPTGSGSAGTGSILSRRPMHPPPPLPPSTPKVKSSPALFPYKFTRNPGEMRGERIVTTLIKSTRGLGIKIVGGDDGIEEFLQIKSIVPHGPAWQDGQLLSGDVLVYVNDTCVLGFTHHEMVNVFQSILPGETVTLEVCRGYPLPFDPNDPNTEVVTTIAVDTEPEKQRRLLRDLNMEGSFNFHNLNVGPSMDATKVGLNNANRLQHLYHPKTSDGFILMKKPEVHTFSIIKGAMGFGFTIADSGFGQKVKKILDRNCCTHLQEGDVLLEINDVSVRNKSHLEVVQMLKDCSKTEPTTVKIQRAPGALNASDSIANSSLSPNGNVAKLRKNFIGNTATGLFRSKTPTADIYSTQQKEILPMRPKTPLVDTRRARVKTPNNELNDAEVAAVTGAVGSIAEAHSLAESKSQVGVDVAKSTNSLQEIDAINQEIPFMDPYPKLVTSLSERLAEASMRDNAANSRLGYHATHVPHRSNYENQEYVTASSHSGSYNPIYGLTTMPPPLQLNSVQLGSGGMSATHLYPPAPSTTLNLGNTYHQQQHQPYTHDENCLCYDCQDFRAGSKLRHQNHQYYAYQPATALTPLGSYNSPQYSPGSLQAAHIQNERMQKRVNELLNDRRRVGFSPLDVQAHQSVTSSSTLSAGYLHHHQPAIQHHSPAMSSVSQQQQQQQQHQHQQQHQPWPSPNQTNFGMMGLLQNGIPLDVNDETEQYELSEVTLERQALGFGFRIVGGTEEGSQVTVGHIVPGGAADNDHRINTGDEILSIDGVNVVNSSHHKVVSLMGEAALRGQVSMILRRRLNPRSLDDALLQQQQQQQQHHHPLQSHQPHQQQQQPKLVPTPTNFSYTLDTSQQMPLRSTTSTASTPTTTTTSGMLYYPYDIVVSRHENEGFGFVIISSSNQFYGSTIGKLIPGSPADRCGELKVGDRIIAVNRIDIAGMSHGEVVNLIKESGLHVRLTIGCPKDGNINGSGIMQVSPGQHSQTHMSQTTSLHAVGDNSSIYFDRPNTSLTISSLSPKQSQQQQKQQQQTPHQPQPQQPHQQQQQQQQQPQL